MKSPRILAIEFTLFEVSIPNIAADSSGFKVWYEPGIGTPQKRFGVRIFTDDEVVGEYVPPRSRATVLMSAGVAPWLTLFSTNQPWSGRDFIKRCGGSPNMLVKRVLGLWTLHFGIWLASVVGSRLPKCWEVIVGIYPQMRAQFMGMNRKGA